MTAFDALRQILAAHPGTPIQVEDRGTSMILRPTGPETFAVSIYDEGEDYMIAADRWHTHETDPLQAAFCVWWLMTPYYRLIQEFKSGVMVATWAERYGEEGWEAFDPVYFINPEADEDWRVREGDLLAHRVLVQGVLPPPKPYREFHPNAELDEDDLPLDTAFGACQVSIENLVGQSLFDRE